MISLRGSKPCWIDLCVCLCSYFLCVFVSGPPEKGRLSGLQATLPPHPSSIINCSSHSFSCTFRMFIAGGVAWRSPEQRWLSSWVHSVQSPSCLGFWLKPRRYLYLHQDHYRHLFAFILIYKPIACRWNPHSWQRCGHLQVPVQSYSSFWLPLAFVSYSFYHGWLLVSLLPLQGKTRSNFRSLQKHQFRRLLQRFFVSKKLFLETKEISLSLSLSTWRLVVH